MVTSALPINESISPCSNNLKAKLKARGVELNVRSAHQIYLNSLAASGRSAMETLLNQSVLLLGFSGTSERYDWHQLTFEKVHLIRSALVDIGYSVNTVNLALSALKGVTKSAFNLGQMSADDMMRIHSVKSLKGSAVRIGRRITSLELSKLLSNAEIGISAKNTRDKAILSVGVGAGLRCSEICALDIADVNIRDGLLTIKQGKGRKHRQIYLAKDVLNNVNEWLKYRDGKRGALFTSIRKDGRIDFQRLSASGLAHALKSLQISCNVLPFSPHDMRRTFITQLLENNVDLNTVRQLAGHSDVSTTVRYDKRDIESQKSASTGFSLV